MANLPSYNPLPPMGPLPSRNPVPNVNPAQETVPGAVPQDTGNSIIEQLLARIKGGEDTATTGAADLGQVAGSLANDERLNRMSKGAFTQNYDRTMLDAQAGRDTSERDALKKLAITNYLKSGGFKGGGGGIMLDGRMQQLPTFGSAPRPASEAQMSSGGTLEDMLKQRLASGGSYLPQPLESYAQPGKVENISRYGGTIASGLGVINDMMNARGQGGQPGVSPAGGSNVYKKIGGGIMAGLRKMVGK